MLHFLLSGLWQVYLLCNLRYYTYIFFSIYIHTYEHILFGCFLWPISSGNANEINVLTTPLLTFAHCKWSEIKILLARAHVVAWYATCNRYFQRSLHKNRGNIIKELDIHTYIFIYICICVHSSELEAFVKNQ